MSNDEHISTPCRNSTPTFLAAIPKEARLMVQLEECNEVMSKQSADIERLQSRIKELKSDNEKYKTFGDGNLRKEVKQAERIEDLEGERNTAIDKWNHLDKLTTIQYGRLEKLKEILIDAGKGSHKSKKLHDWYCENTDKTKNN